LKNGLRIAVFGLITPAVPTWLPPELYSGIEFRDMVETAKLWMPVMEKEKPDLIVGLFHSGWDERDPEDNDPGSPYENGSAAVAREVPGFDFIFNGHDHNVVNRKFVNSSGDTVLILDGGSRSEKIARADVVLSQGRSGGKRGKSITGDIINVDHFRSDPAFTKEFAEQEKVINKYVDKVIATSEADISSRDSYFGSSAFVDMIHVIQLEITGADLSFAAPLSFDVKIPSGPVTVGDMFKLYRFENMLYTISMTGEEIRKYLEFSYADWLNTMKGPNDMLLKFRLDKTGRPALTNGRAWLKNLPYNFDSAAGIDYVVDASKPEGERVLIKAFSNGNPFEVNKRYRVAVNSYRGNGGGGHFTDGAGIKKEDLANRLISSTEKDLRYYILKSFESEDVIKPQALNNWKIIPAEWVAKVKPHEYKLLFGR
jgi:2',3'-cyclic-nucleotide 2'-phosphodiesterase/3'-nucleotidase